jgi:hypothetical protein
MRRDQKIFRTRLRNWFGTKQGTHWSVAGSVAIVIFGGYLIYNGREGKPSPAAAMPGSERAGNPMTRPALPLTE